MTDTTRTKQTPLERAEHRLAIEERKVEKIAEKINAVQVGIKLLEAELARAQVARTYAGQNPALPDEVRAQYAPGPQVEAGPVMVHAEGGTPSAAKSTR